MAETVPDYCPFCGARLRDDGLDPHLDEHDDCAEQFEAWREADTPTRAESSGGLNTGGLLVMAFVAALVLAYSFLIAGQLLLGIIAAAAVVAAFAVAARV